MKNDENQARQEAKIPFPPEFVGVPIPAALVSRFRFVWTPASILKTFWFAWEWRDLQHDIGELRRIEATDSVDWHREWAARELEAAMAAWRGREARGKNPGKELNRLIFAAFEELEPKLKEIPPDYRLGLGLAKATNQGANRGPVVVAFPPEMPHGHFPATLEGLYRLLAQNFGLSVANVKMRISRVRLLEGKARRKPSSRGATRVDR